MSTMLPLGWFVPVTPGTRYVTVGGAIGADIHGKNHHSAGTFTQHVLSMDLLGADGQIRTLTPATEPELFWATAGGMGLTGIVTQATIAFKKVETARIKADIWRAPDLDGVLAELAATDEKYPYTVAWIDCLSTGRNLGRSVLTCGDFAKLDELPAKVRREPRKFAPLSLGKVPPVPVSGLLNKMTGRGVQRDVVPQGAGPQGGRDPGRRRVLPPAGRDHGVEPRLRPGGLPAVAVRRALRRGGHAARRSSSRSPRTAPRRP